MWEIEIFVYMVRWCLPYLFTLQTTPLQLKPLFSFHVLSRALQLPSATSCILGVLLIYVKLKRAEKPDTDGKEDGRGEGGIIMRKLSDV